MLMTVMRECRNHFIRSAEKGKFIIRDGSLICQDRYLPGQYILIKGSILNDGVYQMSSEMTLPGAQDEEFKGMVCGLAVPKEFLNLVEEIKDFSEKEKEEDPTVISETYKGYSYTKATGQSGAAAGWKEAYATRLNSYRRMFPERILR